MIRHTVVPVYLLACLLLGGASAAGFAANLVLQIAALPLIGWALWQLLQQAPTPQMRGILGLAALFVAIALVQLIPLPPALWSALPGRDFVVQDYRLLDLPLPWLPLSLAPQATLASLLWLLPAFAVLLAMLALGAFRGRTIAAAIVAVTLVGIAVGALQVIGGESAYFYAVTNFGVAVGFFANANHNATLMLVCIPFLAALQATLLKRKASPRSISAIRLLVAAAYAIIFVGLIINASLAGIGLGVPIALTTWLSFGHHRPAMRRILVIATIIASICTLIAIAVGPFGNNLFGQQTSNVELTRQTSFRLTFQAARQFLPFGSGTGSFQPLYHREEPLDTVTPTFMNHAHSDWIELLLETGLVGIAFVALFLVWWALRVRAVWQSEDRDPFAQAAAIASAAMMLHSVVDYPLRTAALSAVFAACVALLSGVRPYVRVSRRTSSARHISL